MNAFFLQDSIRQCEPAETLKNLRPVCSKIGITRLANLTHFDHFYGIFVSNCVRPNAESLSVSQGKGSTLELSMISAIMENIEAYHAENPPLPVLEGSYENHHKEGLVDPYSLSVSEFKLNLKKISFKWSQAVELTTGYPRFIPHALTCINTHLPTLDYLYFKVSSNGLAAGNSRKESIFHGLAEVIERDALAKWQNISSQEREEKRIHPLSINDFNALLIEQIERKKLSVKIWEITSDIEVPAYHVALVDQVSLRGATLFTGTGAHLSKAIALFRALSEAIQGRLTYLTGARDDLFESYYTNMRLQQDLSSLSYSNDSKGNDYTQARSLPFSSIDSNLQLLCDLLKKKNYSEILVVDHTKKELGVPVTQTFVPNMRVNTARM